MLDVISTMLGTALKDNEALRFAVITGCQAYAEKIREWYDDITLEIWIFIVHGMY